MGRIYRLEPADRAVFRYPDRHLAKASGADFDKQFVATVGVHDHKQDIALFQKAANDAKSAEVRGFAEATLPTLKAHLASAQQLPGASGKAIR